MMNWCTVLQSFEDNSLLIDLQVIFCCAYADDLSFLNDKLRVGTCISLISSKYFLFSGVLVHPARMNIAASQILHDVVDYESGQLQCNRFKDLIPCLS
jgi:hypothetical protein